MNTIKVLLADDHPVVRGGIRFALDKDPGIQIVGEAEDGRQAVELSAALGPDIVIMDLQMPVLTGIEATRLIRKSNQPVKILMLTLHENDELLYEALQAGVNGYMLKMASVDSLRNAVRMVAAGHSIFDDKIARIVRSSRMHGGRASVDASPVRPHLTRREKQVLQLLAEGCTSQQIAQQLSISPYTVNNHRKNIMRKLNCNNATSLVMIAVEQGLLPQV